MRQTRCQPMACTFVIYQISCHSMPTRLKLRIKQQAGHGHCTRHMVMSWHILIYLIYFFCLFKWPSRGLRAQLYNQNKSSDYCNCTVKNTGVCHQHFNEHKACVFFCVWQTLDRIWHMYICVCVCFSLSLCVCACVCLRARESPGIFHHKRATMLWLSQEM